MAKQKMLADLFEDGLKDILFAEKKILTALPKMAFAARSKGLKEAFEKHVVETEAQVGRLEQVFAALDKPATGRKCPAILGIIEEGQEVLKEYKGSPALDAGLIAAAQSVEHYEISRYGTLRAWAEELGMNSAANLLGQTLAEEEKTDEALSQLAETAVTHLKMAQKLNELT